MAILNHFLALSPFLVVKIKLLVKSQKSFLYLCKWILKVLVCPLINGNLFLHEQDEFIYTTYGPVIVPNGPSGKLIIKFDQLMSIPCVEIDNPNLQNVTFGFNVIQSKLILMICPIPRITNLRQSNSFIDLFCMLSKYVLYVLSSLWETKQNYVLFYC